jgi:hypothetical protein
MWVDLSLAEMINGAIVGAIRHFESTQKGHRPNHGFDPENSALSIHIEGACGEIAVAKSRNMYFSGSVGTFKGADLGKLVQVRTRSRHEFDLIVRSDDADTHAFVLVTGVAPRYCVRGWIYGHEAKLDKYLRCYGNRPAAYFVPQSDLRSIS